MNPTRVSSTRRITLNHSTALSIRRQFAVVRSILDEVERRTARGTSEEGTVAQLVEELRRLEAEVGQLRRAE